MKKKPMADPEYLDPTGLDPYEMGVEAYHSGVCETANPFGPETMARLGWNDGWASGAE